MFVSCSKSFNMFGATLETLRFPKENWVFNRITVTHVGRRHSSATLGPGMGPGFLKQGQAVSKHHMTPAARKDPESPNHSSSSPEHLGLPSSSVPAAMGKSKLAHPEKHPRCTIGQPLPCLLQ